MKQIKYVLLTGTIVATLTTLTLSQTTSSQNTAVPSPSSTSVATPPQEPSLGNYARAVRKDKPHAAKQFDNDNLPKSETISVTGDAPATSAVASTDQAAASPDGTSGPVAAANQAPPATSVEPGQTKEQRQQVYDRWQQKLTIQQNEIDQAARELDLDQREYRLRAASFYADAGERMRNQASWDKEDADYKQKITEKQKALDDAKAKLSDLQEDARKAGVPESAQQAPQAPEKESD